MVRKFFFQQLNNHNLMHDFKVLSEVKLQISKTEHINSHKL